MGPNARIRAALVAAILVVPILPAQAGEPPASAIDLRVIDPDDHSIAPPGEMLHRDQLNLARQAFDARRGAIAAIKTPEQIAARQRSLRAFFQRALGDLPERTPLEARVVSVHRRDGYRVENVIFASRPNHHVTANLYIPEGRLPCPGILLPCGHSDEGKASETYQRAAILLARNGMAVLCYDPIGQGERFQRLDDHGKPVIRGTTEHSMAGTGALLVGRELAGYRIWDGMRALDYLASRPEMDPHRLGCTGNSGGGTMTAYLMALDDRIAVAAPSCYITSLERLFATIGPQDAEQNITGQVAFGMEHADYITMRAPKPTLLSVGTQDFFDIDGSWITFRECKQIYGRLGFGERVDLFESDEPHGFTGPRRVAVARWMSRWLLRKDEPIDEPKTSIASITDLLCTASGQVLREFPGERSVFDLNTARAEELRAARPKRSDVELRNEVRRLIGLAGRRIAPARPRHLASIEVGDRRVDKWIFEVEPGILVPAIEIASSRVQSHVRKVVRVVEEWPTSVEQLLKLTDGTILIQPCGMGETQPGARVNDAKWFGADWKEAFLAFHLGRPLLGQRVVDVLAVLESLDQPVAGQHRRYRLVGVGAAGPIALHAAFLDDHDRISDVAMERSITSWEDVVKQGVIQMPLSNVVPGALKVYDLPDLVARTAADRIKKPHHDPDRSASRLGQ